ncbi:hypothetical protein [Argonema antarcticum]|nr:hypothetical protein [Argonema antarcticum]MCL1469713.1 hypothetical protein [Argonema antarcticum A004/B2]
MFSKSDGDLNIFLSANGFSSALPSPDLVATVKGVTSQLRTESQPQLYN